MRIGKEYKPCEVKFGNGLKIGEAFYYLGEYDEWPCLYMKIQRVEYDASGFHDIEKYNAVKLEDGSLDFVKDGATVTIANVHIEED